MKQQPKKNTLILVHLTSLFKLTVDEEQKKVGFTCNPELLDLLMKLESNHQDAYQLQFYLSEEELKGKSFYIGLPNGGQSIMIERIPALLPKEYKNSRSGLLASLKQENLLAFPKHPKKNSLYLPAGQLATNLQQYDERLIVITADESFQSSLKERLGEDILWVPCYQAGQIDVVDLSTLMSVFQQRKQNDVDEIIFHIDLDDSLLLLAYTYFHQKTYLNPALLHLFREAKRLFPNAKIVFRALTARRNAGLKIKILKEKIDQSGLSINEIENKLKTLRSDTSLSKEHIALWEFKLQNEKSNKIKLQDELRKYQAYSLDADSVEKIKQVFQKELGVTLIIDDDSYTEGKVGLKAQILKELIELDEERSESVMRIYLDDSSEELAHAKVIVDWVENEDLRTELYVLPVYYEGQLESNAYQTIVDELSYNLEKEQSATQSVLPTLSASSQSPSTDFFKNRPGTPELREVRASMVPAPPFEL